MKKLIAVTLCGWYLMMPWLVRAPGGKAQVSPHWRLVESFTNLDDCVKMRRDVIRQVAVNANQRPVDYLFFRDLNAIQLADLSATCVASDDPTALYRFPP